jgi:ribonuclease R
VKAEESQQRIVELLARGRNAPLSAGEICSALELKGKARKQLAKWLHDLVFRGLVAQVRGNRYALSAAMDLVTGRLAVSRSGDGRVRDEAGDTVTVRVDAAAGSGRRGGPTGAVIRVHERRRRDIVGTVRSTGSFLYVVPVDPSYKHDFYVTASNGARVGERVVLRFENWANRHVNPEGEIIERLGPEDRPSTDTAAVIRHFGFPDRFPAECQEEAEAASGRMADAGERLDLRERFVVTIDPERARDYDDALSLERDAEGRRVLGVHIADVSHFVPPGGALDAEARRRGNSVYFPDRVIPMLPEQLSNGVCSLNPGTDRLAFSVFIVFDDSGKPGAVRFERSVIRSSRRLTYGEVQEALDGRGSLGAAEDGLLRALDGLARRLRAARFARHALDLDIPECEFDVAPDGSLAGVRLVRGDASHQLVEECMVAANEAVATELARRGGGLISRFHDDPHSVRLEDLAMHVASLGIRHGDLRQRENLAALLAAVRGDALEQHVRMAVLRSMNRAVYDAERTGHFGLAKNYYAHFTSPIRRYPDLVVHRALAAALGKGEGKRYAKAELAAIADECSRTEQTAEEAERTLEEMMKLRYLARELASGKPEPREAVVVDVVNFGLFVELTDFQIRGLVHASAISERFARYSRRRRTLRAGSDTYGIGRAVTVKVAKVDMDKRQIDFALA